MAYRIIRELNNTWSVVAHKQVNYYYLRGVEFWIANDWILEQGRIK
jgi:hypothetical protein